MSGWGENLDNAGHLLEAALAHHAYTKDRRFLDVMIKVGSGVVFRSRGTAACLNANPALAPEHRMLCENVRP
jgi:DUF1680 family protein